MTEIVTDWNGNYWRDRAGVWRYTVSNRPVPGARDRLVWDGEHDYGTWHSAGIDYVIVPAWRAQECPEMAAVVAQEGALAEEVAGLVTHFLVPRPLWRPPQLPHPLGGMWAPELDFPALLTAEQVAAFMGWLRTATVWWFLHHGALCAPVIRRPARRCRERCYWSRPVLEQWAAEYRARVAPITPRLAAQAAKRRARLETLRSLGRAPITAASRRSPRRKAGSRKTPA